MIAVTVVAGAGRAEPREAYVLSKSYETAEQGSRGSSSSSRGRDELVERVIGVRDGGIELEYDLPSDTTAQDRARQSNY